MNDQQRDYQRLIDRCDALVIERDEARAALAAVAAGANAYAHQRDEARAAVKWLKAELVYARSPEGRAPF